MLVLPAALARADGGAPVVDLPSVVATSTRPIEVTAFVVITRDGATETTTLPDGIDLSAMAPPASAATSDHRDRAIIATGPGGGDATFEDVDLSTVSSGSLLPTHVAGVIADGHATIPAATLLIADRGAPAARVLEALTTTLPDHKALAVSTRAGARAFDISFGGFTATDAKSASAYLVVACGETDAHLVAVVGGTLAPALFDRKVKGAAASIGAGYRAARKVKRLGKDVTAWIQLAPDVSTGRLIAVLDALGSAGARTFALAADPPTTPDPSAASAPRLGQPTMTGGTLDGAILRRYLERNAAPIQSCYEKESRGKAGLAGTVTATFTIAPTGSVLRSTAEGVDATVAACIADVIQRIEFPKPHGGAVTVTYPIAFAGAADGP